jgi:guanyl-specific ribonuclease Sa
VARRSPPLALLLLLTLALASCGGGTTANPVAAIPGETGPTASAPTIARQAPPVAPRTTATAPHAAARSAAGKPRPSGGGAAAPSASGHDSAAASSGSAAAPAGDAAPAPAATAPTTAQPAPDSPPRVGSPLDETAHLTLVDRVSPAHYFQQGTVTGTYDGTMQVEARITSKGVIVSFTATLPGGTISGRGVAVAILDSIRWPGLRGTAAVTGGTGRFAGIHGRRLQVSGRAKPDASKAHVRLAGTVTY